MCIRDSLNALRFCKEFVKFNERCFVRLLGDMHSSNFVVDITPDFEEIYYRICSIDFDQQSYEGKKAVYPVSYTHLDVYKRQQDDQLKPAADVQGFAIALDNAFGVIDAWSRRWFRPPVPAPAPASTPDRNPAHRRA